LQSGSYNRPGFLRLDFAWNQALSSETRSEIEEVSNLAIRADLAVSAQFMSLPEAKNWGAVALFGETYDEQVRVIQIGGPWSRELCGGTHVARSSQIGLVSITNESSVGSGSRRLEANVGLEAIAEFNKDRLALHQISDQLKTSPANSVDKVAQILTELKETQRALAAFQAEALARQVPELLSKQTKYKSVFGIAAEVKDVPDIEALRSLVIRLRDTSSDKPAVIALIAVIDNKPMVSIASNDQAQKLGYRAGDLVKLASAVLGGGGGGKADLAQGGGTNSKQIPMAIAEIVKAIS